MIVKKVFLLNKKTSPPKWTGFCLTKGVKKFHFHGTTLLHEKMYIKYTFPPHDEHAVIDNKQ
jgi:hypothetical protein